MPVDELLEDELLLDEELEEELEELLELDEDEEELVLVLPSLPHALMSTAEAAIAEIFKVWPNHPLEIDVMSNPWFYFELLL